MAPDDFKKAQLRLGLTNLKMAELLVVDIKYIEMLRSDKNDKQPSGSLVRIIEQAEQLQECKCSAAKSL